MRTMVALRNPRVKAASSARLRHHPLAPDNGSGFLHRVRRERTRKRSPCGSLTLTRPSPVGEGE
jgi:hypothetical protein